MRHHHVSSGRLALAGVILLAAVAGFATAGWAAQAATKPQAPAAPASLDGILKELATYDSGIESGAVWKLHDWIEARQDDAAGRAECETKLVQFLKTPATPAARMVAARELRRFAGDTAVPGLQAMLKDVRTADPALYVLQQIPGPAADAALVQSLAGTKAKTQLSVIAAVGQRRTTEAVTPLVAMLKQPALAGQAATALGSIGTEPATQALMALYPGAPPALKAVVAGALMRAAERLVEAKTPDKAVAVYEALAADTALPAPSRRAAFIGRVTTAGDRAPALVVELLGGSDDVARDAAIAKVKEVIQPAGIAPVCAAVPKVPEAAQVQLLALLAAYPREAVLPTVMQAAKAEALPVRIAAMKALATVGDASAVPFLLEQAAGKKGVEQTTARATLGMLKGRAVDEAIVARLGQAPAENIQGELFLAVADRRIYSAKPSVAAALTSGSERVRIQALKALRAIGTPSDVPAVLTLLLKAEEGPEQAEAETTISALAKKALQAESRGSAIRMRLMTEKDPKVRARLFGILPLIGDDSTLPTLRMAVRDANPDVVDAAVRALVAWPSPAARDDAARLAQDAKDETHRLLALGGFIRLVGVDRYRLPDAAIADLRTAAKLASRPEERRLVLGALVHFPGPAAKELANGFLKEADVKAEAEAALQAIERAERMPRRR